MLGRRYSPGPGLTAGLFQNEGNAAIFVQNPPVYRVPPQSASSALPSYRCSKFCSRHSRHAHDTVHIWLAPA